MPLYSAFFSLDDMDNDSFEDTRRQSPRMPGLGAEQRRRSSGLSSETSSWDDLHDDFTTFAGHNNSNVAGSNRSTGADSQRRCTCPRGNTRNTYNDVEDFLQEYDDFLDDIESHDDCSQSRRHRCGEPNVAGHSGDFTSDAGSHGANFNSSSANVNSVPNDSFGTSDANNPCPSPHSQREDNTSYLSLLLTGENSDITIHWDGQKFALHSHILRLRSNWFARLLDDPATGYDSRSDTDRRSAAYWTSAAARARGGSRNPVRIPKITALMFEKALRVMVTKRAETEIYTCTSDPTFWKDVKSLTSFQSLRIVALFCSQTHTIHPPMPSPPTLHMHSQPNQPFHLDLLLPSRNPFNCAHVYPSAALAFSRGVPLLELYDVASYFEMATVETTILAAIAAAPGI
ncbi:hypothetical protein MKZ38_002572 [Zalerion maritima]|uniref:BTB domain-containing protein n=1 Tax=Zalerion maritima TaxID=339359 RepID=A0AAD5WR59_9PEZI|nr:hypothetical protein MKZ38_002572 [Zalerion maritima]